MYIYICHGLYFICISFHIYSIIYKIVYIYTYRKPLEGFDDVSPIISSLALGIFFGVAVDPVIPKATCFFRVVRYWDLLGSTGYYAIISYHFLV